MHLSEIQKQHMTDYVTKRISSEAKAKIAVTEYMWGKNPNYFKLHMLHSHLEIPIRFLEVPNKNRSSFASLRQHSVLW